MAKSNDGLKNNFYKIKKWVSDCDDLGESLNLSGFTFNILKALFGLNESRHSGTSPIRDSNKLLHYAIKHNMSIRRNSKQDINQADILYIVYTKLDKEEQEYFNQLLIKKEKPIV